MLGKLRPRVTYANVAATAALVFATTGFAFAAIPGRAGVIHGCYAKKTGSLRVLPRGKACARSERGIAWNRMGPIGPSGVPGPAGIPGTNGTNGKNGTNGANGATNLIVRTHVLTAQSAEFTVPCNAGERAISGGVSRSDGSATNVDVVNQSAPAVESSPTSMHIAQAGDTPNAWANGVSSTASANFVFYVVCASP
jgi:hypothetical protein